MCWLKRAPWLCWHKGEVITGSCRYSTTLFPPFPRSESWSSAAGNQFTTTSLRAFPCPSHPICNAQEPGSSFLSMGGLGVSFLPSGTPAWRDSRPLRPVRGSSCQPAWIIAEPCPSSDVPTLSLRETQVWNNRWCPKDRSVVGPRGN